MISGAASGFGRLAARRFAAEGARLSLSDRDVEGLAQTLAMLPAGTQAITCPVDVAVEDDHRRWVAETGSALGKIDIAINNAGVIHPLTTLVDTPVEEFDRMMAVNARGVFLAMKHQIPAMIETGGGAILNLEKLSVHSPVRFVRERLEPPSDSRRTCGRANSTWIYYSCTYFI